MKIHFTEFHNNIMSCLTPLDGWLRHSYSSDLSLRRRTQLTFEIHHVLTSASGSVRAAASSNMWTTNIDLLLLLLQERVTDWCGQEDVTTSDVRTNQLTFYFTCQTNSQINDWLAVVIFIQWLLDRMMWLFHTPRRLLYLHTALPLHSKYCFFGFLMLSRILFIVT